MVEGEGLKSLYIVSRRRFESLKRHIRGEASSMLSGLVGDVKSGDTRESDASLV